MSSGRIVAVFNYKNTGKDMTRDEEDSLAKTALESQPLDIERWDFSRKMGTKEIIGYTCFDVFSHGKYVSHICKDCGCEYNLPNYQKNCLKCGSEKVKARDRKLGKCGAFKGMGLLTDNVHPDLLKDAQEDLRNHPVPTNSVEPDWGYLQSEIGD